MTKARNRRNKRIRIDAARENLHKLNADLSDQIDCRKAAEAVHPGTTPRIKGIWTRSEVRGIIATSDNFIELISKDDDESDDESHVAEVHRDLLCLFAPYYRALLNGNFKEAAHNTVILEMDQACCNMFVQWLYTGFIPWHDPWSFCQLYILADQTMNLTLRRTIMTQLFDTKFDPSINDPNTAALLNSLPSNSPLTRYVFDRLVHHTRHMGRHFRTREYNDALYDGIPVDFARKLKTRLAPHREVPQDCPCCHSPCNYHEHDNAEEWKSSCGDSWYSEPENY
ncbi:hypothetical protein KCU71_g7234, partial [Aureobasidium melanogenum]